MIILGTNSIKDTGYDVANSANFESANSQALSRDYTGTHSDANQGTWSMWIKRTKLATRMKVFGAYVSGNASGQNLEFQANDTMRYRAGSGSSDINITDAVFRDTSAWYHIVIQQDSDASGAANQVKIWVNNVQQSLSTNNGAPGVIQFGAANTTAGSLIGVEESAGNDKYGDFYMCEFAYCDGQKLDPTSFGEYAEDTSSWQAKDLSTLTFGNQGVWLDFETSGTMGNDVSGNNNDFATEDNAVEQRTDTCTNNFATLNPLNSTGNGTEPTYSEGNLQSVSPSSGGGFVGSSTIGVSSGKWFFELQRSAGSSTNIYIGIGDEKQTSEIARQSASAVFIGNAVYYKPDDGNKIIVTNGSGAETSYGATYGNGDKIGIALNMDDNQVTFYKNGASQGVISIPTPDGFCFLNIVNGADTADTFQINFGSPPYSESGGNSDGNGYGNYSMSVPSGYFSLNTKNLAEYG